MESMSPVSAARDAASLFTAGIACHALLVASRLGLLDMLAQVSPRLEERMRGLSDEALLARSVLRVLCHAGLAHRRGSSYALSSLGEEVVQNLGPFIIFFEGHAELLARQIPIALGGASAHGCVHGAAVAEGCAIMTRQAVDPKVVALARAIGPSSAIADLGCGSGLRLLDVCEATGVAGLGFDISAAALEVARGAVDRRPGGAPPVRLFEADVTQLTGCYPEVDLLMQAFMTHHIVPEPRRIAVLRGYRQNFPNADHFLVLDTVLPDDGDFGPKLVIAAFDYVHALQGIEPVTRAESLRTFEKAGYRVEAEVPLGVPHSFVWHLRPHAGAPVASDRGSEPRPPPSASQPPSRAGGAGAEAEIAVLRAQSRLIWNHERPLLARHGLRSGMDVADICCGIGDFAHLIRPEFHPRSVVGVDLAEALLDHAGAISRDARTPEIRYVHGDAAALPLPDNAFDFVACRLGLQMFADPSRVLRELVRICRPGGRIYVTNEHMSAISGARDDGSIAWTYREAARIFALLGADMDLGVRTEEILAAAGLEEIRLETIEITNENSDPRAFARVVEAWGRFIPDDAGARAGIDGAQRARMRIGFDAHVRAILDRQGRGSWPIFAGSGCKPRNPPIAT